MTAGLSERLVLNSDLKHLNLVRKFVKRIISKAHLKLDDEHRIVLAADETLSNIIKHAYKFNRNGYIDLTVSIDNSKLQILLVHGGKHFDVSKLKNKTNDIEKRIRQGKKDGFGVFLILRIIDEIRYAYKNGQNYLTLIKYLPSKCCKKND